MKIIFHQASGPKMIIYSFVNPGMPWRGSKPTTAAIYFPPRDFYLFFLFFSFFSLRSDALFFTSSMRIMRSSNISRSDRIAFKNKFGREEGKKKGFQEYTGELFIKRPEWNIEISARDDEFAFYGRVHLFVRVARVSLTIIVLRPFVRIANSTGHYNATRDRRCLTCR